MTRAPRVAVLLAVACTAAREAPLDSTAITETEPDTVSASDTLRPEPREPAFQLIGTEPFWGLRIDSTGLVFTTPMDMAGEHFGASRAVMVGDTLRWNSIDSAGRILDAFIVPGTCSDGMSDKVWTHRAWLAIGKSRYEGCAERRS